MLSVVWIVHFVCVWSMWCMSFEAHCYQVNASNGGHLMLKGVMHQVYSLPPLLYRKETLKLRWQPLQLVVVKSYQALEVRHVAVIENNQWNEIRM